MTLSNWLIKKLSRNRLLPFGLLLTALQILSGALGYVYQIVMGRILSPVEFALFSSIMALFMFMSAPIGAMSMLIVRKVSALKAHSGLSSIRPLFFQINKLLIILTLFFLPLFLLFSPYLENYLKAQSFAQITLFSIILFFSFITAIVAAFLQGLQRYALLGSIGLFGMFGKLITGALLVKLGFGVEGALIGVLIPMILIGLFATANLFRSLPKQIGPPIININFSLIGRAIPVIIANLSFAAMTQLDIVLVNWYFSSSQAGLYAAAAVLGKAVLYLPGGLIAVLFPMVSEDHAKGACSLSLLRQALITTILASGSVAIFYWVFSDSIISILYGQNYDGAGEILRWYGLAILPLTIVVITEQYLIAKAKTLFSWIFLFMLPIELFIINVWHSELWMILTIMGVFNFLLAIIGYVLMYRSIKSP